MFKLLTCVLVSTVLVAGMPQGLKSKKWELPASMKKVQEAFDAKKFGACMVELKSMTNEVGKLRSSQLFAAMPAPPAGFESPEEKANDADMAGWGLFGMAGVKREYQKNDGNVRMTITLMSDSPIAAGLAPLLANPQLLGGEGEIVNYGAHKGILKLNKADKSGSLQLLIGAHMVNAEWSGLGRDDLDPFLSEDAVKKMAEALQT